MKRALVIVGLVAVLALSVGPLITGILAENRLTAIMQLPARDYSAIEVTIESYERGWFESHVRVRMEIKDKRVLQWARLDTDNPDLDQYPSIIIETSVAHGPIAFNTGWQPVLAVADSTLEAVLHDADRFKVPGRARTIIGLTGSGSIHYSAEPIEQITRPSDATIDWEGADITTYFDAQHRSIQTNGVFGAFTLTLPAWAVVPSITTKVGPVKIDVVGERSEHRGIFSGSIRIDVAAFEQTVGFAASGFHDARYEVDMDIREDKLYADVKLSIQTLIGTEFSEPAFDMRFGIDKLDAAATSKLLSSTRLMNQELATGGDAAAYTADVMSEIETILAGGPSLHVDEFNLYTPAGNLTLVLNITVPPVEPGQELTLNRQLLSRIDGNATIRVPKAVVDTGQVFGPALVPGVDLLVQAGIMRLDKDVYAMDGLYQNGVLTVNGVAIPVPIEF